MTYAAKTPSLLLQKMRGAEQASSTDKKIAALQKELKVSLFPSLLTAS